MGCWCLSVRRAVMVIGVLTGITSTILCVGLVAAYVTLEDHVTGCRLNTSSHSDYLQLLPSCTMLTDASFVLASRVFIMVQVALWLLLLVFSGLLVVAAVKGRSGLLVPWVVLTLVVMGSIVYDAVQAGLKGNTTSLLISVGALAASTVCLLVVWEFSKQLSQRQKATEAAASSSSAAALLNSAMFDYHRHTPPSLVLAGSPGSRFLRCGDVTLCQPVDLPPDYDTAASHQRVEDDKRSQQRGEEIDRPKLRVEESARSTERPRPRVEESTRSTERVEDSQRTKAPLPTSLGVRR